MPEPRYGIFLRPDPTMAWAVTQITHALRAQFGLISAAAFPPHVTIQGSLAIATSVEELEAAVDRAVAARPPVLLITAGIRTPDPGIPIDVHTGERAEPDGELQRLARAIFDAVLPLGVIGDDRLSPRTPDQFHAHLSLASHDLARRPDLYREVRDFVDGLPVAIPSRSFCDTVSLFEFHTAHSWYDAWWETLTWRHLRSWTLR
ncbi:heme utilization protein [Microbacterium sp. VKM Ac-2870]|uniref:2'-5' RNA ligase family protein n=1 Tax=Microbacterium sp. VKM Ac-2870 TaxID=2783825 RepID=UPI00188C16FD|nr:2'-5' RNA ligase family protein [Microbacterium sp. VKM Ac-2870]MBF4561940.1 heme utilization protein [Microbacterium sp. VKM Ac-2870]